MITTGIGSWLSSTEKFAALSCSVTADVWRTWFYYQGNTEL